MVHLGLSHVIDWQIGLSYAVKQRRHFKASEFVELLKSSTKPLDSWYNTGEVKAYYRNHISSGASATRVELSKYVGKMGAGLAGCRNVA